MAQAALSVQAVADGRFTLGLGPSHPVVIEEHYGMAYDQPAAHTRDYLSAMQAAMAANPTFDYEGPHFRFASMLEVPGSSNVSLLIAALAPMMLRVAGEIADGTITYWANERAIANHVVPRITGAAVAAGRPQPRVIVGLPVAVVDDVDAARQRAAKVFQAYQAIPAYQRILDVSGVSSPVDVAIIGDEARVAERIASFESAGATELLAAAVGLDEDREASRRRTESLLADLAR
jgi:F420-dependent oxidoreductase-like protein